MDLLRSAAAAATATTTDGHWLGAGPAGASLYVAAAATLPPLLLLLALLLALTPSRWWRWSAFPDIPGPRPLPVVGNMVELALWGEQACHVRWMARHGPIFKYRMGVKELLVVGDPEIARELFVSKFRSFHDRTLVDLVLPKDLRGMIFGRGKQWAHARSAVQPLFHSQQLADYAVLMNAAAAALAARLQRVPSGSTINIYALLQEMTVGVFVAVAFGGSTLNIQTSELLQAIEEDSHFFARPRLSSLLSLILGPSVGAVAFTALSLVPGMPEHRLAAARALREGVSVAKLDEGRVGERSRVGDVALEKDLLSLLARATTKSSPTSSKKMQASSFGERLSPSPAEAAAATSAGEAARGEPAAASAEAGRRGSTKGGLGSSEAVQLVTELIAAGSDTTSTTLAFAMYLLASHPEKQARLAAEVLGQQAKKQQQVQEKGGQQQQQQSGKSEALPAAKIEDNWEMEGEGQLGSANGGGEGVWRVKREELVNYPYTMMVVKEALRLFPVAPTLMREATEDAMLSGADGGGMRLRVPKNSTVLIPAFAMHRSAAYFSEPDEFHPERFGISTPQSGSYGCENHDTAHLLNELAYLPFGAGPRMCIGYKFALQEACIALIHIFHTGRRFSLGGPNRRLQGRDAIHAMRLEAGLVLKPKGGVWVSFEGGQRG